MIKYLLPLLLCLFCLQGVAQTSTNERPFGLEFRIGMTLPLENYHGKKVYLGPTLGLEGHSFIKNSNFDIGYGIDFNSNFSADRATLLYHKNYMMAFAIWGNYTFPSYRPGLSLEPYVGVGLGGARCISSYEHNSSFILLDPTTEWRPYVNLRGGVRIQKNFKVGLSGNFYGKHYNNIALTVGFESINLFQLLLDLIFPDSDPISRY